MENINYDLKICEDCKTIDCLMKCQYIDIDYNEAVKQKKLIINGKDSSILHECVTCYACEQYCPNGNHPFYQIVELQEKKGILPAPIPITKQQIAMMKPKGRIENKIVKEPVINLCTFKMLAGSIYGKLYEGASVIMGSDIFCNIMWLHFAKISVIRERVPKMIDNIMSYYLNESNVSEIICYHDECYGTYTQLAEAFGINVPFKSIHLFEYLSKKLDELSDHIKPLNVKVAYQRPCSNRLISETQKYVDEIFEKIGAQRVDRVYDRDNALCCGGVLRAHQKNILADEIQKKNIDDMVKAGVAYCVFNCPFCMFTLGEQVAQRGIFPILMSDLCQESLK